MKQRKAELEAFPEQHKAEVALPSGTGGGHGQGSHSLQCAGQGWSLGGLEA